MSILPDPTQHLIELEKPYRAVNGHTMVRPAIFRRGRVMPGPWSWAYCTPTCPACADGDILPDY